MEQQWGERCARSALSSDGAKTRACLFMYLLIIIITNNYNNGYLKCLSHTGPKLSMCLYKPCVCVCVCVLSLIHI